MISFTAVRTLREVAEILGMNHQTVYFHEQNALKKLRKRLAHLAPETPSKPQPKRAQMSPDRRVAASELRWRDKETI